MENARFRQLMQNVWTKDFLVIVKPTPRRAEGDRRYSAHAYSLKDYALDFIESGPSEMEALEAVARRLGLLPPLPPAAAPTPGPDVRGPQAAAEGPPGPESGTTRGIWTEPAPLAA